MDNNDFQQFGVNPVIDLSKEDFEALLRKLDEPPKDMPELRELFDDETPVKGGSHDVS